MGSVPRENEYSESFKNFPGDFERLPERLELALEEGLHAGDLRAVRGWGERDRRVLEGVDFVEDAPGAEQLAWVANKDAG